MTLYIDGVEAASTTTNVDVTLNDTSQVLRVGGENTGTYDYQWIHFQLKNFKWNCTLHIRLHTTNTRIRSHW